ncbi:MAG: DNA-3-methyladenine glycosylase [Chloroflexota bacterium]
MAPVNTRTAADAAALRGPPSAVAAAGPADLALRSLPPDPVAAAEALLGMTLVVVRDGIVRSGTIVETEAYGGPEDRASHARAGRTARTAPMFGPPGHAYVYLVYGIHHCLNVVAHADGTAGAVLLRALRMDGPDDARIAAGPGRLTRHLGIDRRDDGRLLAAPSAVRLVDPGPAARAAARAPGIVRGPRIGIDAAGPGWADRPWRFGIRRDAALSRPFPET